MSSVAWYRGWRKYGRVFLLGIQEQMEYRVNYLFETLLGMIAFAVLFFLWRAIYAANHWQPIAGLDFRAMLTYILLAKFWDWVIDPTTEIDTMLPEDIRGGGLNRFLTRPLSDRFYRFSLFLSHKVLHTVMRLGPVIVLVLLWPGAFRLMPVTSWGYLPLVGLLAMVLQFSFSYVIAMVAFWWLEIWGVLFLKRLVTSFLAGAWLPLTLFPAAVAKVFEALPFHYLVFFPVQIALGNLPAAAIHRGIVIQLAWIGVFAVLGHLLWQRGMKQYSAAGI